MAQWLIQKTIPFWLCIKSRFSWSIKFSWATLIAALIAMHGIPPVLPTVLSVLVMILIPLSIGVYNDAMDFETDIANKLSRPIVEGRVSQRDAIATSFILAILGITLSLLVNLIAFLLSATGVMLGFLYSFSPISLKKRFLLKQFAVASGGLISSLVGGAAVSNISSSVIFAGLIFFVYALAVVPIVDIGDMEGDRKEGRRTLPIVWGPNYTIRFAIAIMFAIAISGIVGYLQLGFNMAFPILVGIISISCIYVLYPLFSRWQDYIYCRKLVGKITFLHYMLQLSFVIGSLRF